MINIINTDAIEYLSAVQSMDHVVTGICDMNETGMTDIDEYISFFRRIASMILEKTTGYCIFIQTDRKYKGTTISKSNLLIELAKSIGVPLMWHKIVLRRDVDKTDLHRPTYSHMLCFSRSRRPGKASPDVIPVSKSLYSNGTPFEAAIRAVRFIKENNRVGNTIVDPFVGRGTIVSVARDYGFDAIGIDIDANQCLITENLLNQLVGF